MVDNTYDLDVALKEAADKFREKVRANPDELCKRLERRKTAMLSRPLRAWCLAVRAGDRRITPYRALVTPEYAVAEWQEHTVVLDARLLRWLCRPVRIPFPGLPAREVARMLGCAAPVVMAAATKGSLDVKRIKGLDGVKGWVPVVYAERYLDPSAGNLHRMADPLWGTSCRFLSDRVPEGVEQVVKRVPYRHGRLMEWMWLCPAFQKCVKLLFYPMPPVVSARILLPEEMADGPAPGGLRPQERDEPPATFACRKCHRLVFFSRACRGAWNLFISRLTGGMLYGSEVSRPPDFPDPSQLKQSEPDVRNAHAAFVVRKFRKTKQPPRPLTERNKRVRDMLVENRTHLEMAAELRCSLLAIKRAIRRVLRFHAATTRQELARKLGRRLGIYLKPRGRKVMEMLAQAKRYGEIARTLAMTYWAVKRTALRIYNELGIRKGRQRRERFVARMQKASTTKLVTAA